MAYVEVYNAIWSDWGGTEHEVKLLKEGGANVGQIDVLQPPVFSHSIRGGKKVPIGNQITGSETKFNFVVASADIAAFDAIFESEYKDWKIEHYYNSVLDWVGWLQPENFSRQYIKSGDWYFISLSAVDGLANLKNIEYVKFSDGSQYEDRVSLIATIKRVLEHTEIDLDFKVQLATYVTNDGLMTASDSALEKVTCDSRRFIKTKDGRRVNTNCYEVITEILKPFNSYLMQSGAKYWIINTRDRNADVFNISWTTLTKTTITRDIRIDITDTENFTNKGEIQKIKPFKEVGVTFRDRNIGDNLLSNGDFAIANTNEWIEGPDLPLPLATVSFEDNYEMVMRKEVALDGTPSTIPNFYSIAESIVVLGEEDQVQLEFKVRTFELTMSGSYVGPPDFERVKLLVQLRKTTPTGDIILPIGGNSILLGESNSAYTSYVYYFNILDDDDYHIEFLIDKLNRNDWSDYERFQIRFDDIFIISKFSTGEDVTFDKYFKVTNTDSNFLETEDIEINFGDSVSDSDIAAFKVGGTRTETWNRWNKTENISINVLVGQNIIENHSRFKDYLRIVIIDDTDRILPHSIITIGSRDYQIVSQTSTFKGGDRKHIKVELIEVLFAAVGTSVQITGLSTVDGDSSSNTPFTDSVTNPGGNPGGNVGITDHGALTGLGDDDHPQYDKVLTFERGLTRSGNIVKFGGSNITENVTLSWVGDREFTTKIIDNAARYIFAIIWHTKKSITFAAGDFTNIGQTVGNRAGFWTEADASIARSAITARDITNSISARIDVLSDGTIVFKKYTSGQTFKGAKYEEDNSSRWGSIDTNNLYIPHLGWIVNKYLPLVGATITENFLLDGATGQSIAFQAALSGKLAKIYIQAYAGPDSVVQLSASHTTNSNSQLLQFTPSGVVLQQQDTGLRKILMLHSGQGIEIQDTRDEVGLNYPDDYSTAGTALGDRWIPDLGFVMNQQGKLSELSADPSDPAEGNSITWQSDGTGSGDDGDIMMKITAGGTTKTTTLVDFSAI